MENARAHCSARLRSLDFPGDFHAFPPLASELITRAERNAAGKGQASS